MQSKLSLLTAAALSLGLTATAALAAEPAGDAPGAKSDITIVTNDAGSGGASDKSNPTNLNQGSNTGGASGSSDIQSGGQSQGSSNKTY